MNTNTKRLFFTALILGTILSVLTATTVMASTNNILNGQQQRDQDHKQLCQNDRTFLDSRDSCEGRQQHGSECPESGNSVDETNQVQHRCQHRHCHGQSN
jgi:hypothetical protein